MEVLEKWISHVPQNHEKLFAVHELIIKIN